jgi:hypothetical protein
MMPRRLSSRFSSGVTAPAPMKLRSAKLSVRMSTCSAIERARSFGYFLMLA